MRNSTIHGRGVFALAAITRGERVVEYKGKRITDEEADRRYPDTDESKPYHTFLFSIEDGMVIDGNRDANSARWINHGCAPNCESSEEDGQVFIEAIRDIRVGEELTYDYNIILAEPHNAFNKRRFFCACGAKRCRGTMLGKKR